MIRAVKKYAEGQKKGEPPPALPLPLRYAFQAEAYGTLPNGGGLRDQPVALMAQMSACLNVYRAWRGFKQAPDKVDWKRAHPEQWRIAQEVLRIG